MNQKRKPHKLIGALALALAALVYAGCKKQSLNDLAPVAHIVSVAELDTSTVLVTAVVTANNGDPVAEEGFCFGKDSLPAVTENQKLLATVTDTFSAELSIKPHSGPYFFRCFTANSYGYSVSPSVKN